MPFASTHLSQQKKEPARTVPLSETLTRTFQLPEDCRRGRTLVSMTGRERISIENFRGICSYTPEAVRLTTAGGRICVTGKCLQIDCYTKDEIEISGRIKKVEFE